MAQERTFAEIAQENKIEAEKVLAEVKKALSEGNLVEYSRQSAILKTAVATYNQSLCNVEYAKFAEMEHPMIEAVKQFYINTVKIKEERNKETDVIENVKLEEKQSRIDLEKFCDFAHLDKAWTNYAAELLALLTLRETNVYAMKPSELAKKNYYFIKAADRKKAGETPDSNTQIVSLLQKIIDNAIFVDNGEGKNVYKCNNHDIAFIQDAVTKIDTKEKCTIAMLNERQFKTVLMSVFAHCLGEVYKVKGKNK